MEIKIKYFDGAEKIGKIPQGDWIDLRANKDVLLDEKGQYLIPLGVAMELPKGYEAHIVPRSSTFKNYNIIQTNSMAVIDESYCGDNDQWFYPVYYLGDKNVVVNGTLKTELKLIHKGDRICQFRIVEKQPEIDFIEVETLGNKNRGGFGSTGVE